MRSRLSVESVDRSNAPPASLTGTPSTRILAYLLSPPRMKSDVAPPYDPVCTIDRPGTVRSASVTVVIPSRRRASPVTTVTDDGVRSAGSGERVAVTATGESLAVSDDTCCAPVVTASASVAIETSGMRRRKDIVRLPAVKGWRADQARGRERRGTSAGAPTAG